MYKIHLYDRQKWLHPGWTFPLFPVNSYKTNKLERVLKELEDLFNNHDSGITKIVIENDEFEDYPVCSPQSVINLDNEETTQNDTVDVIKIQDIYFYVNKAVWCTPYINQIMKVLDEHPVHLVINNSSETKLLPISCVAEFKENLKNIENYINFENN